jgi:hypothetical protein
MTDYWLSAAEVATWVGVHYRTIENWKASGKIESKEGKYGLKSAVKYRLQKLQRELDDLKNDPQAELKMQKFVAEVNTQKAIARIKTLEADQLEGTLVNAEEILVAWKDAIANCKAKLLSIPTKVALELSGYDNPKDIEDRLSSLLDEALSELSN